MKGGVYRMLTYQIFYAFAGYFICVICGYYIEVCIYK